VPFATACMDAGARFLQLRAKRSGSGALLDTARRIVRHAAPASSALIVNDRADVALLSGAAGVHVGQDDLSPAAARTIIGPQSVVGLSTHTMAHLEAALAAPVSYVAVGPVFGTTTKDTGYAPIGLEAVRRASRRIRASSSPDLPLVAIGGITLENACSALEAGADSVAVISDLISTGDPADRVSRFLRALGESH
jgi:thiamine-phosphate pyrophosphorylase